MMNFRFTWSLITELSLHSALKTYTHFYCVLELIAVIEWLNAIIKQLISEFVVLCCPDHA